MNANAPGASLAIGEMSLIDGFIVEPSGPTRRPAFVPFNSMKDSFGQITDLEADETVQDVLGFYKQDMTFVFVALTNKCVRVLGSEDSTWQRVPFGTNSAYVISSETSTTFVSDDMDFNEMCVRAGDMVHTTNALGADVATEIVTVNVDSLEFDTAPVHAESSFWIEHRFSFGITDMVDYTYAPSRLLMTDGSVGGLVWYDGALLSAFASHAAEDDTVPEDYVQGANSVMYFNGRVWLGGVVESDVEGSRFVRWSSLTDITEFAAVDYVVFSQENGAILKLASLEDIPVVFMETGVYTGFASDTTGLPFAFAKVEVGQIVLAGIRAWASFGGGLVFVATDNIYFLNRSVLSATRAVTCEAIGTDVVTESVRKMRDPRRTQVIYVRELETLFLTFFNDSSGRIWRTFFWNARTKAWSYSESPKSLFVAFASMPIVSETTWHDLIPYEWSDLKSTTWAELAPSRSGLVLFAVDANGALYVANRAAQDDSLIVGASVVETPIPSSFETGDLDFDAPDMDKVLTRINLKINDLADIVRTLTTTYGLSVSGDRGYSWTPEGDIALEPGTYSDEAHFRARSDAFRVRLASTRTGPLALEALVLRVRPAEIHNVRD